MGSLSATQPSREDVRTSLEQQYGQVWDTEELSQDYEVLGFMAPYVKVRRQKDRQVGTLEFSHHPRFYFDFQPSSR